MAARALAVLSVSLSPSLLLLLLLLRPRAVALPKHSRAVLMPHLMDARLADVQNRSMLTAKQMPFFVSSM